MAKVDGSSRKDASALAGSKTCRDCHADFYKLWATSWHGLAMQPYTAEFAKISLTPQQGDIQIGSRTYRAEIGPTEGFMRETGPGGERRYPIAHVLGGKNVRYFLTPMARGRLQVLPLAYDVHKKSWYDVAASGVRHFPDRQDEALDWTDRMFAFNTTCFNSHVTELATNYDLATDTYHTTWTEPGITCESCHGPAKEHVRVMEACAEGRVPEDIKIIRTKDFSHEQMNDMCATCHAKMIPLSLAFKPGEKFFDHYDLIALEHVDFYPDGRDLGENYTMTTWRMSRCAASGRFDCNHCHTPSGRMRFEGERSNEMCMPCHAKEVNDPAAHGHHEPGSRGNACAACHMPMTRFAGMNRSDHSMRPPMPAATLAFQSPNACNLCHDDHDAAWADRCVREWYARDYQAEPLRRAGLIDAARKQQWDRLPDMLAELESPGADEINKASLVRLLAGCDDQRKRPVLLRLLEKDPSPLVRSSAASVLGIDLASDAVAPLLAATADAIRLVRIRAAAALAPIRPQSLPDAHDRENLERANREYFESLRARPDDWASHANEGNFLMARGDFAEAAASFETAMKLEPRQIGPIVNAAIAYSNLRRNNEAERCLRRALEIEPANAAALFNLGLLRAEQDDLAEAEQSLRAALKADPRMPAAAYNLGVLLGEKRLDEAVSWCHRAHELQPADAKYARTLAFFLWKQGDRDGAKKLLEDVLRRDPSNPDARALAEEIEAEPKGSR